MSVIRDIPLVLRFVCFAVKLKIIKSTYPQDCKLALIPSTCLMLKLKIVKGGPIALNKNCRQDLLTESISELFSPVGPSTVTPRSEAPWVEKWYRNQAGQFQ